MFDLRFLQGHYLASHVRVQNLIRSEIRQCVGREEPGLDHVITLRQASNTQVQLFRITHPNAL